MFAVVFRCCGSLLSYCCKSYIVTRHEVQIPQEEPVVSERGTVGSVKGVVDSPTVLVRVITIKKLLKFNAFWQMKI